MMKISTPVAAHTSTLKRLPFKGMSRQYQGTRHGKRPWIRTVCNNVVDPNVYQVGIATAAEFSNFFSTVTAGLIVAALGFAASNSKSATPEFQGATIAPIPRSETPPKVEIPEEKPSIPATISAPVAANVIEAKEWIAAWREQSSTEEAQVSETETSEAVVPKETLEEVFEDVTAAPILEAETTPTVIATEAAEPTTQQLSAPTDTATQQVSEPDIAGRYLKLSSKPESAPQNPLYKFLSLLMKHNPISYMLQLLKHIWAIAMTVFQPRAGSGTA